MIILLLVSMVLIHFAIALAGFADLILAVSPVAFLILVNRELVHLLKYYKLCL